MKFYEAKVADILRLSQRDEQFVNETETKIQELLKLCVNRRDLHRTKLISPIIAKTWYYLITSLNNLQTLGEEYTGCIRLNDDRKLPSKLQQTIWLILYVGGDPLLERLLNFLKSKINRSQSLTSEAKNLFLKAIEFIRDNKQTFKRIHHSIFYINGRYYNVSNRLTNIKYVLLREWMQDNSFTESFRLLGNLSLFYIIFNYVQQIWYNTNDSVTTLNNSNVNNANISKKKLYFMWREFKVSLCHTLWTYFLLAMYL